jgi:two-component system chemotaxis response regulator CheY
LLAVCYQIEFGQREREGTPDARQARLMEVKVDPKKNGVGKTVLVVDDSALMRKAIESAFLSDGFKTCVEAKNGKEGIEVAKHCHPDLIILDFSMPVMNGLDAAPILRKLFPKIPIFLFLLYAEGISKEDASKAGVDLVISKYESLSNVVDKAHEMMGTG